MSVLDELSNGERSISVFNLDVEGKITFNGQVPPVAPPGLSSTGSWIPVLQFAGSSSGITTTAPTFGEYSIVGNVVFIMGGITLTSKGVHSATDIASIVGLPIVPAITVAPSTLSQSWSDISFGPFGSYTAVAMHVIPSLNAIAIEQVGTNAVNEVSLQYQNLNDNTQLLFSGLYFIA